LHLKTNLGHYLGDSKTVVSNTADLERISVVHKHPFPLVTILLCYCQWLGSESLMAY